jgi:hypothetical protein
MMMMTKLVVMMIFPTTMMISNLDHQSDAIYYTIPIY